MALALSFVIAAGAVAAYLVASGLIPIPGRPGPGEPNLTFELVTYSHTVSGPPCDPGLRPLWYRADFRLANNGTADAVATLVLKHKGDNRTLGSFELLVARGEDTPWRDEIRVADCLLPTFLDLRLGAVENLDTRTSPVGPRMSVMVTQYGGVWTNDCSVMWNADFLLVNAGDSGRTTRFEVFRVSDNSVFHTFQMDAPARDQSMKHYQIDTPSCDLGDDLALRLAA